MFDFGPLMGRPPRQKDPILRNTRVIESATTILRKKRSELIIAEEFYLETVREVFCDEYIEAIKIVLKEQGYYTP